MDALPLYMFIAHVLWPQSAGGALKLKFLYSEPPGVFREWNSVFFWKKSEQSYPSIHLSIHLLILGFF